MWIFFVWHRAVLRENPIHWQQFPIPPIIPIEPDIDFQIELEELLLKLKVKQKYERNWLGKAFKIVESVFSFVSFY